MPAPMLKARRRQRQDSRRRMQAQPRLRLLLSGNKVLRAMQMEDSDEQRTSKYASRRGASALRFEDAVARVSRAAESRVARAARCMAGAAARMEGELPGRVRPTRSFRCRSGDPGLRRRDCTAAGYRPYQFRFVLELVWTVVAAAADRRGIGAAGRVGAGHAPQDSGAAWRQLYRHPDSAGIYRRIRGGAQPYLGAVGRR